MKNVIGLTSEEAKRLLRDYGSNTITSKKSATPFNLFISQFPNVINLILVLAGLLSFFVGETVDAIFIFIIVLLNGVFGFIQEYRAEKAAQALKKFVVPTARVIRDGKEQSLLASEIVPGDVVIINEGEKIVADGTLIEGVHLEVDEAVLTGESLPVLKLKDKDPELFMGTTITKGRGKMLVTKTGNETRFGEVAQTLSTIEEEKTPLNKQIDTLGKQLALVVGILSIILFVFGFFQNRDFFETLFTAISVSVAGIPEGLPAVITIALALGMQKMARRRAIVRKMAAIETLGATQVILTDKTGTLTQNDMRVKKVWHEGTEESLTFLLRACVLGNTASIVEKFEESKQQFDIIGDKTDGALLLFAKEHKEDLDSFLKQGEVVDEYVFDPVTKTVTTVWKYDHKEAVFVRGAPERILEVSKFVQVAGKKVSLTDSLSLKMREKFNEFAKEGLRIIGFGYREVVDGKKLSREELEQNMTFLGFVGIYDPPRLEAKEAVRLAKEAGIKTIMVTGDNEITALSVAKEVGLIEEDEDVVLGKDMRALQDDALMTIAVKTRVFARTTPMDKLRLVEIFKKLGFVVAVTGDGVNDALALKKADVGVAMGKTGTDVAKEASDVIVTDDNFASLVSAVEEGRAIYDNIMKAITFLITANAAEVLIILVAVLLGLPTPLVPTQILWMNLVTDGLPALALASDIKDQGLLRRAPRDPRESILNPSVLQTVLLGGIIMTAITLGAFIVVLETSTVGFARTVVFNLIIALQLVFIFFVRGKKPLFGNRFLLIAVGVTILVQTIIMTVSPLHEIFHIEF